MVETFGMNTDLEGRCFCDHLEQQNDQDKISISDLVITFYETQCLQMTLKQELPPSAWNHYEPAVRQLHSASYNRPRSRYFPGRLEVARKRKQHEVTERLASGTWRSKLMKRTSEQNATLEDLEQQLSIMAQQLVETSISKVKLNLELTSCARDLVSDAICNAQEYLELEIFFLGEEANYRTEDSLDNYDVSREDRINSIADSLVERVSHNSSLSGQT